MAYCVQAQDYSYVNYNVREGLAGPVVYCMAQDRDGFMWFGTETGLSRFDGTHFTNFTTTDGLPDNEILILFVDSRNRVWIVPFQRKICYYYDGKLHTAENDSLLKQIQYTGNISGVVENDKQEVLVVQSDGVTLIKPDDKVITVRSDHPLLAAVQAGLNFDGSFLVNTIVDAASYVNLYTIKGNNLVPYKRSDHLKISFGNGVYLSKDLQAFYQEPNKVTFFTGKDSFELSTAPGFINMCRLNDSIMAITSVRLTEFINVIQRKKAGTFLANEKITSALEDREGNLWFTSMGNGVYRLASRSFNAKVISIDNRNLAVHSINRLGDSILIGSDNYRVWSLDPKTHSITSRKIHNINAAGRVTTLDIINGNKLLAGTDAGLVFIDGKKITKSGILSVKSTFITEGSVLVGHHASVQSFRIGDLKLNGRFFPYRAMAIYKRSDTIFIGSLKGLFLSVNDKLEDVGQSHKIVSGRISSIKETSNGILWVATYGQGIAGYKNGHFSILINQDSGLTSNIVRTLFVHENVLWAGTDKGLNKIEMQDGKFRVTRFTSLDGLISNIVNAVFVDNDMIYVGTPAGLSWFREREVFTNSICSLKLMGISSVRQPIVRDTQSIEFDHYDTDIRIDFTAISFKSAGEMTYQYRLRGLDDNLRTTSQNFLVYPTLPSGNYLLELQAVNKFGVKSKILHIPFSIKYLLWEKTWFQVLAVGFLVALVWIFTVIRINKIRKQERVKSETNRKIAELEQMALKAQINPHFIFNSLNSIQHYMFERDVQGANRFITAFSRLIRLTLEMSSKNRISLEEEIDFLTTYLELEMKRFENKFNYQIQLGSNVEALHLFVPPMLLQPYVENSIRHGIRYRSGNQGMLKIDFTIAGDYLLCSIEDNGIGRERSKQLKGATSIEYQSKGMTLTARRIEMMNKSFTFPIHIEVTDLYIEGEAAGTRIVVKIPVLEMNNIPVKSIQL